MGFLCSIRMRCADKEDEITKTENLDNIQLSDLSYVRSDDGTLDTEFDARSILTRAFP